MAKSLNIEYLNDSSNWIDESLVKKGRPNYPNGLFPNVYTNYFKLYFPVGLVTDEKDGHVIHLTYKELANRTDLNFTSNFSYASLIKKFDGLPSNFVVLKEKDGIFISKLIDLLGAETETTFEGFGDDVVPDEFQPSWRISGKLKLLTDIFSKLNKDNYHDFNHFPNYVYAKDKSWCIATKIFQSGVIVIGCNAILAGKIHNQDVIDFQEINYEDEYFEFIKD